MKIANIDRESLRIFWKTWVISMKFSAEKWLTIILKGTKIQGFNFSLEDTFLEKPRRAEMAFKWALSSLFMVKQMQKDTPRYIQYTLVMWFMFNMFKWNKIDKTKWNFQE